MYKTAQHIQKYEISGGGAFVTRSQSNFKIISTSVNKILQDTQH